MKQFQRFVKKHGTFNMLIVAVCLVLIWRAVWHAADHFFGTSLLGDILPGILAFVYLYVNDYSLEELEHDAH